MTETILKIAALIAFAGAVFGFLQVLPPLPDFVITMIESIVRLTKLLDTILPVHEQLTFFKFAFVCIAALWGIELLGGFIRKTTSSGK